MEDRGVGPHVAGVTDGGEPPDIGAKNSSSLQE